MGRKEEGRDSGGYYEDEFFRIKDFDRRLLDKLVKLIPDFKKARRVFGADDSVGFGSLPECHGEESIGALTKLTKSTALFTYEVRSVQGISEAQLFEEQKERIIVPPNMNKQNPCMLSIYHEDYFENPVNEFLDADKNVYIGTIAHELAHWRLAFGRKLPKRVEKVFESIELPRPGTNTKGYLARETRTDLVASMFGYAAEIISSLNYLIARFHKVVTYLDVGSERRADYVLAIEDFENKKAQVIKYCIQNL